LDAEGPRHTYKYKANGTKYAKRVDNISPYMQEFTEVDYLDGFQYERKYTKMNTAQNPYDTGIVLKFAPTSEGYFDFEKNKYIYNYSDHLGNTRLSYFHNGSSIEVLEENNYYPFGLKHEGYNGLAGNPSYQYKYNGKELQETGMYDYGARFYMPDIGRWGVVDPLAEMMTRHSPYNYAFNNPIIFVDPDGMSPIENDLTSTNFEKNDKQEQNEFDNPRGSNKISTAFVNERNGKTVIVNDGLDDVFYVGELDFSYAKFFSKHIPDYSAGDEVASSYKNFYFRIKYGAYAAKNWKWWVDSGPNWSKISGQTLLTMEIVPISPVGEADAIVKLTRGGLKTIGNLTHLKDVTVAEAVIARGGKLGNLSVIEDAYKSMKVVEIANKAAQGDEKAMTALKIIKQASSKAQKY
jgi:RHS repeat-associated protein